MKLRHRVRVNVCRPDGGEEAVLYLPIMNEPLCPEVVERAFRSKLSNLRLFDPCVIGLYPS